MWKDLWSDDGGVSSTDAAGFTNPNQSTNHPMGLGFPHRAGRYRPGGDHRFRSRIVGFVDVWRDIWSTGGSVSSPGTAGFTNPSQSTISQRGWAFRTVWAVSSGWITVFVHDSFELKVYERIYDPGTGAYPPRVRRNRDVAPRGNSRCAPDDPPLARAGKRTSVVEIWNLCDPGMEPLSSPDAENSSRCPEGQLSTRACPPHHWARAGEETSWARAGGGPPRPMVCPEIWGLDDAIWNWFAYFSGTWYITMRRSLFIPACVQAYII